MNQRRVVCAALRVKGKVMLGVRHYDAFLRAQLADSGGVYFYSGAEIEQGFVDQYGNFLTREEAHVVATEAGQIINRCGGDEGQLFSENLY